MTLRTPKLNIYNQLSKNFKKFLQIGFCHRRNTWLNGKKSHRKSCFIIKYMDMIDLLRKFIKAERTGDWILHLQGITEMFLSFAAWGHNLYLKSSLIFTCNKWWIYMYHQNILMSTKEWCLVFMWWEEHIHFGFGVRKVLSYVSLFQY